jgi:hypothetical protein
MNINDIVRIKNFEDLPEEAQTQKVKNLAGQEAEIVDRLYSESRQEYSYILRLTGAKTVPAMVFPEAALELVENEPAQYYHHIEYLENLVLVRFYKVKDGKQTEIARGHGHIIHEGAAGVAQATSYAMRRIWEQLGGGSHED